MESSPQRKPLAPSLYSLRVEGAFPPDPFPMSVNAGDERGSVGPYLRAIRSRPLIVLIVTLAALGGAIAWVEHRSSHYKATADILFTPVPSDNEGANGLPVLRDSSDPTRLSQTAASLLDTPQASILAAAKMGPGWTASRIRAAVNVEPQGQSDIISVVGKASSARLAQRLANAFVQSSLVARRTLLQNEAASLAPLLKAQALSSDVVGQERKALISALSQGQDPNFSLSQSAGLPSSPTDTPAWLVIALALLAGFALGSGTAVVTDTVSDRIRGSDELLSLYRLPVLAYVPPIPRRKPTNTNGMLPTMPLSAREAFRMIRVQLDTETHERHVGCRTIMITSGSSGDGKTTSSIAIATALAEADHRVILMDLDLRKPDLGQVLQISGRRGVTSLLDDGAEVSHMLSRAELPGLSILPAGPQASEQLLQPVVARMSSLVAQLREMADYVVIDTPPLGEVSDAYQLLPFVDQVVVVARPGHTRRANFQFMRDLLVRASRTPLGIVVVGETTHRTSYYYYGKSHTDEPQAATWVGRPRA
jgi:tyrosine-protein kinase